MALTSIRSSRGFTLVEALVAATLLTTSVVVLAHMVAIGTRQRAQSRRVFTALLSAQAKLEELRARIWSSSDPSALAESPPGALARDIAGFVDESGGFVVRWAIVPFEPLDPSTVVLQVCAYASRGAHPPEACVSAVRTRRP